MLSKLTPQLKYVFRELERCKAEETTGSEDVLRATPRNLLKELTDFLVAL